jgi:glycerophosphoryl diester phosphodiesterase
MHSSQIDQLDAGSWFSEEFKGERVPRLEAFMNAIKGEIKIYFDIKSCDLKEMVDLVYKCGFQEDCFFWSSDTRRIKELRELDNTLAIKMTVRKMEDLEYIMDYNPQIIECRLDILTPRVVDFCRENDLWIMVNALARGAEKNYQRIIDSPADLVNLDYPDIMIDLMNQ